ncbi:uncharacterized protein LOC105386342 [Plutella xylostella]|uniref:uncharacterized protein LOC105386342 n=1 Tax=Plutella xylostella TaxID=51655 RepID=UPI002032339F|nr:uncharacterized protein LOC105386342 [Plutella xylostella]
MGDTVVLCSSFEKPHNVYKFDSGVFFFNVLSRNAEAKLDLLAKICPHKTIATVILSRYSSQIIPAKSCGTKMALNTPQLLSYQSPSTLTLSWHSGMIQVGRVGGKEPIMTCRYHDPEGVPIGFVRFHTQSGVSPVTWVFDIPPERPTRPIKITTGQLRWVQASDDLPTDAIIGGFERNHTYIARAHHNGSLTPGKYVPSKKLGFIPWGHQEHAKERCEILCGYNVEWVWTYGDNIPENAVIGGQSEGGIAGQEPLYISRAMHNGFLIPGKVHAMYKTCYLPYNGGEVEVSKYEILVSKDKDFRGIAVETVKESEEPGNDIVFL